jgi:hypothetical protein
LQLYPNQRYWPPLPHQLLLCAVDALDGEGIHAVLEDLLDHLDRGRPRPIVLGHGVQPEPQSGTLPRSRTAAL